MNNWNKIILDLCGGTGSWSKPYTRGSCQYSINSLPDNDVRLCPPPQGIYGILAAPPCTDFASSGARWWEAKGKSALLEALSIVDACYRIISIANPVFWCLENPIGRLVHYLGEPVLYFDPCDYGDPYTKKTCLWGNFNIPAKNPVEPTEGSKMWRCYGGKSERTKRLRSATPPGFAQAFYEANR